AARRRRSPGGPAEASASARREARPIRPATPEGAGRSPAAPGNRRSRRTSLGAAGRSVPRTAGAAAAPPPAGRRLGAALGRRLRGAVALGRRSSFSAVRPVRSAARAAASAAGFLALALLRPLGLAALAPAAAAAATAAFRAAPAFHVVLAFGAETVPLALLARQSRRRAFGEVEIGVGVVRGVVRRDRVAQVEAVGLDDDLPAGQVFPRQEGHRDAGGAGAAGAADPVHVRLGLFGGVVVDDVRDVGD